MSFPKSCGWNGAITSGGTRRRMRRKPLTRDDVGKNSKIGEALLEGSIEVTLADGKQGQMSSGIRSGQRIRGTFRPARRSRNSPGHRPPRSRSWLGILPKIPARRSLRSAWDRTSSSTATTRTATSFLLAALTGNVGKIGGNVGSYAGNYRTALFNGAPQYINENPFDIELDRDKTGSSEAVLEGGIGPLLQSRRPSAACRQQAS